MNLKNFKNYQLLIFDFDGTIAKLDIDWEGLKKALKKLPRKEHYQIIAKYETAKIQNLSPRSQIIKIIKKLSPHKKMAIFSDNLGQTIQEGLKKLKIKGQFDLVVGRDSVKKPKPHPEGLLKIIKTLNMKKNKTIYIGNSAKDKLAGEEAGIKTIII